MCKYCGSDQQTAGRCEYAEHPANPVDCLVSRQDTLSVEIIKNWHWYNGNMNVEELDVGEVLDYLLWKVDQLKIELQAARSEPLSVAENLRVL